MQPTHAVPRKLQAMEKRTDNELSKPCGQGVLDIYISLSERDSDIVDGA